MARFIEIPIVVSNKEQSEIDYEGLGIEEPESPKETINALVNLDNIGRINSVEEEELYKTCLFPVDEDQCVFRSPLGYDELKDKILDHA